MPVFGRVPQGHRGNVSRKACCSSGSSDADVLHDVVKHRGDEHRFREPVPRQHHRDVRRVREVGHLGALALLPCVHDAGHHQGAVEG